MSPHGDIIKVARQDLVVYREGWARPAVRSAQSPALAFKLAGEQRRRSSPRPCRAFCVIREFKRRSISTSNAMAMKHGRCRAHSLRNWVLRRRDSVTAFKLWAGLWVWLAGPIFRQA